MKAAFVHLPKTAGCSIRAALQTDALWYCKHARLEQSRKSYSAKHSGWDALFKFIFVRNPWDRWREFYMQHSNVNGAPAGFSQFVRSQRRQPGWDFDAFDFVGQFEYLDRDMQTVAETIGEPVLVVPHLHPMTVQRDADWRAYYDDDTRDAVANLGAWEIGRFGYRFDDCATQRAA